MTPEGWVDIDGVLHAAADARISVFDRGFLYGDSAFEALRTYGGRPFRCNEHLTRLTRSCERLRIPLPLSQVELEQRITAAIAKTGLAECYLRIVVTRGAGALGLDLSLAGRPSVLIYALALKTPDPAVYRDGIAVGLVQTTRVTDGNEATGAKASNYLASLLALDDVKQRGCQEAVLLGPRGEVLEGSTSNVFVVLGSGLATPPVAAGILEGITRREVLALTAEIGMRCEERTITAAELKAAREVFITSSIREIVPVVRVDDTLVGNGKPGSVVAALLAAYRQRTLRAT
jgi:branched-chain amino acid aminotransferase